MGLSKRVHALRALEDSAFVWKRKHTNMARGEAKKDPVG